ncbi:hypothetical protein D3C81_2145230 [compost metagenome]
MRSRRTGTGIARAHHQQFAHGQITGQWPGDHILGHEVFGIGRKQGVTQAGRHQVDAHQRVGRRIDMTDRHAVVRQVVRKRVVD